MNDENGKKYVKRKKIDNDNGKLNCLVVEI